MTPIFDDEDFDFSPFDGDGEIDGAGDSLLPPDFFPPDMSDDDRTALEGMQRFIDRPLTELTTDFTSLAQEGRAGELRAIRFGSEAEALLWLFRRGIFLYSNIVRLSGGLFGVAIGTSPQPGGNSDSQLTSGSIPF